MLSLLHTCAMRLFWQLRSGACVCVYAVLTDSEEEEDEEPRIKCPDRGWLKRRQEKGVFEGIFKEPRAEDVFSFRKFVRIDDARSFSHLADFFATNWTLTRKSTKMWVLISLEKRVALTFHRRWLNCGTCSGYKKCFPKTFFVSQLRIMSHALQCFRGG